MGVGFGEIAPASMSGALKNQIHERAAPQASSARGIGADIFTRLCDQRITGHAAKR
jgi:hypothetical protein